MNIENRNSATGAFPVIGIGASAGGLEALKAFFETVKPDCNSTFVVITHRDPSGVSLLPEILGKHTTLPIEEARNGTHVEPGHVYTSPASHYLRMHQGKLLFDKIIAEHGVALPIDYFFRSLADEQGESAICIVLSGSGSDGTLGMRSIKGAGGMAMAQDVITAQFGDMPGSVIATGLVDYVLPPKDMPERLLQYTAGMKWTHDPEPKPLLQDDVLGEMLLVLRQRTGNDFSFYKTNTLGRRIERRMNVHHIAEPKQYVGYLKENAHEIDLLFKELLIGVTSFFRDPAFFAALEKEGLPELLKNKIDGDMVRMWVAGCSTGEEAYTLAILLREYMERTKKQLNIQIFATDLDNTSINHARTGLYADGIALDVSPERLERYFTHADHCYRIKKNIREMVVFASQNLIQDPPFTKLDLVSCRNLLIYLDASMQKKILPLFYYSLQPGGLLMLGSSETVGTFTDLFAPLHARGKLFKRKDAPLSANHLTKLMNLPRGASTGHTAFPIAYPSKKRTSDITELAQTLLLEEYTPPCLIVNENGDIIFIHGRTGLYLEPSSGSPQPNHNALDMAREGLRLALAAIIRKAATQETQISHNGVRVRSNGHYTMVNLRAKRITEPESLRGLIWIVFEKLNDDIPLNKKAKQPHKTEQIDEQSERELQFIKQNLQNTIEELETSNEELKSTNEELQSTNEELQSANEELETAKEEMQSLNEELHTVNSELETKINDLSHANDDMKNLLNNTGIATVFLDNNLNIKRFTVQVKKIIHLIQTDIGRPISDIVSELEYTNLIKDATEVMHTLAYKEIEVRMRDWSWYLMRIMPYRTAENVIEGLVITFVDITKLKKSEILLAANIQTLELLSVKRATLVEVLDDLLLMLERQSTGLWCSVKLLDTEGKPHHVAAPTLPQAFQKMVNGIEVDTPFAIAARQQKPIVIADMADESLPAEFTSMALKYNIRACWAQPIYSKTGKIVGVLTLYYQHVHQPSIIETEFVGQVAPLMGMAITRSFMEKKDDTRQSG
jgi:two-component system CheB/CheR fusion protein